MNKFTKTIAGIVAVVAFVAVAATGASAATFTRSLTVGSTGADVTALQTWLNSKGYLAVAPTGYFGNLTKAAVAAFQTANGITPAVGYFGPISQAKWEMVAGGTTTTTTTTTTTSTTLAGTDGSISDVNELSQYSNEDVGESQSDIKVAGFEVEASNDGDIAIKSAKISITITNASGSDNLDDYVDTVKVLMGSKEVGSASADDFSEGASGVWSKTITLSAPVVKSDDTEKFYVTVDAAGSFDSGDIDSEVAVIDVDNLRFEDGSGVVTTETGYDLDGMDVSVDFVSFSTSADTELKISTDSTTPEAGIVIIDDVSNTDDVVLLKGKIKVDGTSDVLLDELPVTLTTVGGANVAAVAGTLTLSIDGEEYSESVLTTGALTGTTTFDNLDLTLSAGKTYSFTIKADINDIDSGNLDEGDTLVASVTSTNRDYVDAENEEGDQLADSTEKSGTATGEAQEFRTSGIQLVLVSTNTSVAAGTSTNDDQGTFTIKFKVKAIGENVYVSSLADAQLSGNTSGKTTVLVDRAGTATVGGVSTVIANNTDTTLTSVGNYMIEEGSEETFTLTTTVQLPTAGAAGLFRAVLGGVSWSTTDVYPVASSYTSNLDSFKTDYVGLN